jgi:enediyne biosynthesis protein E4
MRKSVILILLPVLFFSCSQENGRKDKLFTILPPSRTHINFRNDLREDEQNNLVEYLYFNNGAGVAAGDINNDGLTDLFFTSNQNPDRLYLNKGNFVFEDITETAGVAGTGNWKTGVTMADVNGDGLLDIYVCEVGNYKNFHGKNQLFINQGNNTFKDEAPDYGLDFCGFSTQASFFDYDGDGDLDMYLVNHSVHSDKSYGRSTLRYQTDPLAGDRLYRHDIVGGKHVFTDVTKQAGIYSSQIGYGLGINVCDINSDGLPDIFISNDFHENDYLYINNGNGTFTERLTEMFAHTSRSSMGDDVADINNDGLPDLIVLDMLPDREKIKKQSAGEDDYELYKLKLDYGYYYQFVRNSLQVNLGGGLFSETGRLSGVYSTDWSWSPLFCDLDNDGWKDIFITSGIYRRPNDLDYLSFLTGDSRYMPLKDNSKVTDRGLYSKMPLQPNNSYLFRNNSNLTFTNVAADWGIDRKAFSNGATYADLDNDGLLDLAVNNINDYAFICKNTGKGVKPAHYLSIVLKGSGMNTRGIGSRVTFWTAGMEQIADQYPTRGFLSSTTDVLHFGLGQNVKADSVKVTWPDRSEQVLYNVTADRQLKFDRADAHAVKGDRTGSPVRYEIAEPAKIKGLTFLHSEDIFDDLTREKLMPHSLAAEGPAMAVGDVNGDGLTDLFIGCSAGNSPVLFIQQKDGTFIENPVSCLSKVSADITDAVFFDADGDGDSDLYLVSGGNEFQPGDPRLQDRLLINDGKGIFTLSPKGSLPVISHNGSCVRPCDFDGDGDIDLFIGSRSVPGSYGWSPNQYLLENDGKGHFRSVISEKAELLKSIGMVTDAVWTDYDGDGDKDLIIVGEWMNITVFRNDRGHFTDQTSAAGLGATSGMWNCIKAADLNGDGKTDLVAGNIGLNSILKSSPDGPVEMYLGDFDNNGSLDQVICSWENGKAFPVASLDELSAKISGLKKKYPRYADFGEKSIIDIFGKNEVQSATVKKAELLESSVFINTGNGIFIEKKLPVEAQFSPVRDIIVRDINGDGITDLILAGNDYRVRPSYGRYDASYGWCLVADSLNNYHTLMPARSGFEVKGDCRKLISVSVGKKEYLLVGVNNDSLKVFSLKNK